MKSTGKIVKTIDQILGEAFVGDQGDFMKVKRIFEEGGIVAVVVKGEKGTEERCMWTGNLFQGLAIDLRFGDRETYFVNSFFEDDGGKAYGTFLREWVRFPGDDIASCLVFDGTLALFLLTEEEKEKAREILSKISEDDDIAKKELEKLR